MKKLFFLTIGMFSIGSSSFMIAGLVPKIGQSFGESIPVTSQGITAFSLTYLFSAPLFSFLFANKSAKKTLQLALFIFLLGNILTLFSDNIFMFLIGRIVTGLGAGIFNPLCVSIAIHLGSRYPKGKILSLIWGANSAGVVFGVPLGVYLSNEFSWRYSILYILILGAITFIGFSLQKADIRFPTTSTFKERISLLADTNIMSVVGITCLTSLASLGLYSYIAPIHTGAPYSLTVTLFFWGLGGFIGSSLVGHFVDRTKNPQKVMAIILFGLGFTFYILPYTKSMTILGLLTFFIWGALGWATPTPQQHVLFDIQKNHKTILSALNSSAIGLGSSLGTAIGGIIVASGFDINHLSTLFASVLVGVGIFQLMLVNKFQIKRVLHE